MATSHNTARFGARHLAALGATAALAFAAGSAQAEGVPGVDFYIGAGVGQSNADADSSVPADFDEKDIAWKAFVGLRALSYLGAEVSYIDFGKPKGDTASVKYKGIAGYGLFYLPLPLPILDVYVKAGVARVDVDPSYTFSTDDTKFAFGGGLQLKFSSYAIRGEYEQFKVEGSKPSLISLSFSKSFL